MRAVRVVTATLLGTGALALSGLVPSAASAASSPSPSPSPTAKPSASCKVPVLTVAPLTAAPGSKVTVSGVNFSGCPAQGNPAKPTPVLTIQIGVGTAAKMGKILATTRTTSAGTFSVQVTVPALATGGIPKLALIAASTDPATGLTYLGAAVLAYSTPAATSSSPAATSSSTAPANGGGVPTAVPAGNGGQAATVSAQTRVEQGALAFVGVALVAAGGIGFGRRRASVRKH